jgi:putative ABC transport system ATP-binding protein
VANARDQVREVGATVLDELELRSDIERVGLDHQVGPAGRLLTSPQRAAVNLLRSVVKRPDILVVDGALAPFGENKAKHVLQLLLDESQGRTLAVVLPNDREGDRFDTVIRFSGTQMQIGKVGHQDQGEADVARPEAAE